MNHALFLLLSTALLSHETARFAPVFKQGFDTSCGIAVTASLLDKYWGIPVQEAPLYQAMLGGRIAGGSPAYTINFLTIQEYLQRQDMQSKAYSMDWDSLEDTLAKNFAPLLINYAEPRSHFALLLHIERGFAFVADPAKGIGLVERRRFERYYSGNVLLAASRTRQKDEAYLKNVIAGEQRRLAQLERLARSPGRR